MYQVLGHYINGEWVDNFLNADLINNINPSTEEIICRFPKATKSNVEHVVRSARLAQQSWRKVSRVQRAEMFFKVADLLMKHHDKIMRAISLETGKNLNESHAEILEAQHMALYVAGTGRLPFGEVVASEIAAKESLVIRKPKGVVAVISPWNFPLAIGAYWCAAPAIAEGNCVVLKPSELTPLTAQYAAEIYHEAGFPPGVFNLIQGDGETGAELVKADVDVILFTGSAEVGRTIRKHCADTYTKTCSCECGSKSAVMVFEDGNFDLALDACVASATKTSGQRCVSSGRLLIERSIYDTFCEHFAERMKKIAVGDPFDKPTPDIGPLISREQFNRVEAFNQMVRDDKQVNVLLDGSRTGHAKGFFLNPMVYKTEWRNVPYLKQEVFGPNISLVPFDNLQHACEIYEDTEYGLSLGAISNDIQKHKYIRDNCTTGMLYVNGGSVAAESHLPFSSWKKSGYSASASATAKMVTHTMTVTTNYSDTLAFPQGMNA